MSITSQLFIGLIIFTITNNTIALKPSCISLYGNGFSGPWYNCDRDTPYKYLVSCGIIPSPWSDSKPNSNDNTGVGIWYDSDFDRWSCKPGGSFADYNPVPRCCNFNGYEVDINFATSSVSGDDNTVEVSCNSFGDDDYSLTGCTLDNDERYDGIKPSIEDDDESYCTLQSGIYSKEVIGYATCLNVVESNEFEKSTNLLDCYTVSGPSPVSCNSEYTMFGCSGIENHNSVRSWYINKNNGNCVVEGRDVKWTPTAHGICCRISY